MRLYGFRSSLSKYVPSQGSVKALPMVAIAYRLPNSVLLMFKSLSIEGTYSESKKVWPKLEKKVKRNPKASNGRFFFDNRSG